MVFVLKNPSEIKKEVVTSSYLNGLQYLNWPRVWLTYRSYAVGFLSKASAKVSECFSLTKEK
jgi:hypothetical protein